MIIGFTCGAFDLLHSGHLAMLATCKKQCDYLVVGLHSDPTIDRPTKNKPIQTMFERWMQLNTCKFVDEIIPYDTERDLVNMMATLKINKRFVGMDHQLDKITGQSICERRGINIVYTERLHDYSSSELRGRLK
ncbi:TagD Cytidylyltransferase [uncultured Caudovirales phage]|uniref:TagD Cytidylyltransferase n=1 Tax=uncultured Caudovirales phage TaxID=2100421 RepID=A0A6J5QKA7_9CAUD|nr:TagD Cytidylyltransferase [uncultured Caudovirales phage]